MSDLFTRLNAFVLALTAAGWMTAAVTGSQFWIGFTCGVVVIRLAIVMQDSMFDDGEDDLR